VIDGELWIAGESHRAASGETFPVRAPADGRVIGHAARAGSHDVDRAVRAAAHAARGWASLPAGERERLLLRAADLVQARGASELLDLVIDEGGSAIRKARSELSYTASLLRTAAGEARRLYGDTFPNDDPRRVSMVFREPLGVVAVISPFNAPLALLAKMLAFPLAAGNAAVVKPSEETPLVALAFARILHDAGLPPGVVNVLTGLGADCGRALVEHPRIDGVAFTGSTATGVAIAQAIAPRMCRAQLELGGNNALVVLADMDPVVAAEIAAAGAFAHAGQICMASSRIIVERPLAAAFTAALARAADALHLGDLRDERTAYGPLIHARSLAKVEAHVADARARGARVCAGGEALRGLTYRPTVIAEPPRESRVWREETFGPVTCVVAVDDLDAAIDAANDSEYGLSAGVLTNDLRRGLRCARAIRAGAVHVGTHSFQSNALAPVGGLGLSGVGRSGGKYSTEEFTELRWVSAEVGPC
jgi:aldehyde dehydrogenase (NAD+)